MNHNNPLSTSQTIERFVVLCLRSRWDPSALSAARALVTANEIEWEALSASLIAQGLAPLLYDTLRGSDLLPPSLQALLHGAYVANAARNSVLLQELRGILGQLSQEGVAVILLKGAALLQALYGSVALRPMGDLDLLVHRRDVPTVLQVLSRQGYARRHAEPQAGLTIDAENEMLLYRDTGADTAIEVHWSLFDSPYYQERLSLDWLWETTVPLRLEGLETRMLGVEAQLLHLCGHLLLHHQGKGLLWLHDIAEWIVRYRVEISWETLLEKAQTCELVLALQYALHRVASEWSAPVPTSVLTRLDALEPSQGERRIVAWLTKERRPVLLRFWADLTSMPSWSRRLRYALVNIFPSPAYMQRHYRISHPLLIPCYYPYRWIKGLWELLS